MEQQVLNYFRGYVRIRITGNCYDRFLNLCAFHKICLWDLCPVCNGYETCISRKDFRRLKSIVKKSHVTVCIVRRCGLPFFIHKYRKRRIYVVGIAAACLFLLWLSSHIWNISIEGNISQTDDVIFEYLAQEGISHGMLRSAVDCKVLASQIRNYFSDFSWVAAELKGTRLIIYVKEGIMSETSGLDKEAASAAEKSRTEISDQMDGWPGTSLAASKSGIVESIFVRKGTPLVSAGEKVELGTVLVDGALPIYNDSKEIVSWQYVNSDADIVISSKMQYSDTVFFKHTDRCFTGEQAKRYILQIGSMVFALPGRFFSEDNTYTVLMEQTQLKLMENFYLPVYVQKFTAKEYENLEIIYTKEEAERILNSNMQYFMKNLEEKGVQIFENDVKIEWNEKSAIATGTFTVGEYAVREIPAEGTEEELQENEFG